MELRRLRYFMRIASEGSLGKASASLGVAQPALGRQIQMLEAELGVKLFWRVSRGMKLTEEGEYLKDSLRQPLEMIANALLNVRSHTVPVDASLVLGLPPLIAQLIGPRIVERLRRDFPNLRLRIAEGDSGKLAAELALEAVDIAILVGVVPPERVYHFPVVSEDLMLVVASDAPIAGRASIRFGELADHPLILPGVQAGLRTKLAKVELSEDIALNVPLEIDSIELTKRAVRAGHGYAVLPRLAFKAEAERGELTGIAMVEPTIPQIVYCGVRPLWRVPRQTYDRVMRAIFQEWFDAIASGEWPATWVFDDAAARRNETRSQA